MNAHFLDKFIAIKQEIEQEKGSFIFFALFEKSESPGIDVVFAADWTATRPDESVVSKSIELMSQKIMSALSSDELRDISGIIPLPPRHPIVSDFVSDITADELRGRRYIHLRNLTIHDISLSQAYILAADRHGLSDTETMRPLQHVA